MFVLEVELTLGSGDHQLEDESGADIIEVREARKDSCRSSSNRDILTLDILTDDELLTMKYIAGLFHSTKESF